MRYKHFDVVAGEYDNSLPKHVIEHYLSTRLRFVRGLLDQGVVLDVGCGTGSFVSLMRQHGFQALGLDPSEKMLRQAERKNRSGWIWGEGNPIYGR